MQPTLAPAPHPPHQHLSSPGAQVQPSYLKDEHAQTLIEGWDDQQDTSTAEQALRAHLLQNIQQNASPKPSQASPEQAGSGGSHDENLNIDPAISGVGVNHAAQPQNIPPMPVQHQQQHPLPPQQNIQITGTAPEMSPQGSPEDGDHHSETPKRGGKRELSTSKRAAQNRAAQRAFRQRKEGYIKKLEEQVRDLNNLEESYKAIQNENYQLRDYIISLQSRLIESQGEDAVPPAPILIQHQQPQQTLPFQPPPPGVTTLSSAQAQPVQHAPAQAAPTAPMGVPVTVPPTAPMVPQAPMVAVQQPAPPTQPQPQAAQQTPLENGAKRSLEDENPGYAEFVKKKLRGEDDSAATAAAATAASGTGATEVNGNKQS